MKKILKTLIIALFVAIPVATTIIQPTYAAPSQPSSSSKSTSGTANTATGSNSGSGTSALSSDGSCHYLFGFKPWYCGWENVTSEKSIKNNIKQLAENILDILSTAASYLALGFVVWGGYLYMMSSGDPSRTATAKKTMTNAFIGLAIAMLAKTIVGTIIGGALGSSGGLISSSNGMEVLRSTYNWAIGVAGVVCVIFVVLGGYGYMTSTGDPGKLQKAKRTITYALIGLAIVGLSAVITNFVLNTIESNNSTSMNSSSQVATTNNKGAK